MHYQEARGSRTLKVSTLLVIEVIIHCYFPSGLFLFSSLPCVDGDVLSYFATQFTPGHFFNYYFSYMYTSKSVVVAIIWTVLNFNQQAQSRHIKILTWKSVSFLYPVD